MYRVTTRGAAQRAGEAWMAEIVRHQEAFAQAVEAQDAYAMIEANREFHVAIAERAGNPYYTTFFARLLDEGRRILRLYYQTFDDRLPRRYVEEHEKIIAAILIRRCGGGGPAVDCPCRPDRPPDPGLRGAQHCRRRQTPEPLTLKNTRFSSP